jgi:hypothetical protein
MENSEKHLKDIAEIRQMMEQSSRFISLSGWSGIFAGVFALIGSATAILYLRSVSGESVKLFLIADAIIVLVAAMGSALYFSWRKARKQGARLWSSVTRKIAASLAIPLFTGGIYSTILLIHELHYLIPGVMLIFYGIALVSAGRFINRESVILGIVEIILGIAATIWAGSGIWFWGCGFGLLHIIYGITLHYKYDGEQ